MIRLEVAYTENAGRFYRGHLTVNGENIETFNWLHEVNEYLTEKGSKIVFPQGTDEGDIYAIQKKATEDVGFLVVAHDCMDIL